MGNSGSHLQTGSLFSQIISWERRLTGILEKGLGQLSSTHLNSLTQNIQMHSVRDKLANGVASADGF